RTNKSPPSTKRIVDDQGHVIFFCQGSEGFKIRVAVTWVGRAFQVYRLGFFVDQAFKTAHIVSIGKANFNAYIFKRVLKLVITTSFEGGGRNVVIHDGGNIIDGKKLG